MVDSLIYTERGLKLWKCVSGNSARIKPKAETHSIDAMAVVEWIAVPARLPDLP